MPQFGQQIFSQIDKLIQELAALPEESEVLADLQRLVTSLTSVKAFLRVVRDRQQVKFFVLVTCAVIGVALYLYAAVLFGFVYLAIAKLQHVNMTVLECLANAVFMPSSSGRFPNGVWFTIASGLQYVLLAAFGISAGLGILRGYVLNQLNNFLQASQDIDQRLQDQELERKLANVESRLQRMRAPKSK